MGCPPAISMTRCGGECGRVERFPIFAVSESGDLIPKGIVGKIVGKWVNGTVANGRPIFIPFSSHYPPFFSHSGRCSCTFRPDLLMIPHFPPFSSIYPAVSHIFPHFPAFVPFFQTADSWFW